MSGFILGLIGGAVSGLATTIGGIPVLLKNKKIENILKNINMDFVTGLMLSASALSLIAPAFQRSTKYGLIISTLISGALFIYLVGKILDQFAKGNQHILNNKKAFLFIIAMMAHNFPEGLASGASMTISNSHQGISLLSAISIQNLPEGLTTALSFISIGANPLVAFLGNMLTGVVELIGGMIGGYMSSTINGILPYILAFAGGAMMSLTLVEIMEGIRESSIKFFIRPGFITGVIFMMALNNI